MSIKLKFLSIFIIAIIFFVLGFSSVFLEHSQDLEIRTVASIGEVKNEEKEKTLEQAKINLGENLQFQFTHDDVLISIHGKRKEGKTDPLFDIKSDRTIIDRAYFVLDSIKPLLPYNPGIPLDVKEVIKNENSADVLFLQKIDGVFFGRYGSVLVQFGAQGEVVSIKSDYLNKITLKSRFILDLKEAKESWIKAHSEKINPKYVSSGRKLIWIMGNDAYRAYEFIYKGQKYIVNAETGRQLLNI